MDIKETIKIEYIKNPNLVLIISPNLIIEKAPFGSLEVGDRVSQIGRKGENPFNRVMKFTPYAEYVGTKYIRFDGVSNIKEKVALFKIREEDKPRDVRDEEGVYMAFNVSYYVTVGYELSMVNPLTKDISLFKPIFSKYEVIRR